jgi:hypothetical protein
VLRKGTALRFCGSAADSRFVGDVDNASDGGNPFATSVVRSRVSPGLADRPGVFFILPFVHGGAGG